MAVTIGSGITIGGRIGVGVTPTITIGLQPSSVIGYQGETVTFTTSATANFGAVVSYQWAKLEAQGGSWTNILGATSSSYTTGTLNVSTDNGDQYRCVISASRGAASVNTSSATLYVEQAVITIDQQPQNQSVAAGSLAEFTVYVSVTLSATVSFQWQNQIGGSGSWYNILDATSYRYEITANSGDNGNNYRVIVSATKGATSVTSNSATLTIVADNTMTVGSYFDGYGTYTGASIMYYPATFGTLTSDYYTAIYSYSAGSNMNSSIFLMPGTYSGFTVGMDGQINSDTASYPRYFSIDNATFTFVYDSSMRGYTLNDSLPFIYSVGETIPVTCDGSAPSLTLNTIICSSYINSPSISYGASTGTTSSGGGYGPVFGTVVSNYLLEVSTTTSSGGSSASMIRLKDGSYSGFSVSGGAIDNDPEGASRIFTIDSINYTFIGTDTGSFFLYVLNSAITPFTTGVGTTFPVIYDPSAQGGGGENTTVGTITIASNGTGWYGWQPYNFGSGNFSPNMVYWLYYDGVNTFLMFQQGTYGSVVVTSTTVDGESSVTVTVGSVTETGALVSSGGGPGPETSFSGDVFNLGGQLYQTVAVEILAGTGGGGGGSITYVGGVDYQNGQMGQPGIYFSSPPSGNSVFVYSAAWTTPAGATALLALTSGSTFTVSTPPSGGGAPVTAIVTLTSTYNTDYGTPSATITTSVPISYSYPNNVPASVTLSGGGGEEVGSGSLTVGTYGSNEYGYDPYGPAGPVGSLTISPIAIENLVYFPGANFTVIIFTPGTYGSVVVTSTTINGSSSVSVTIGGVAQTGTLQSFGPSAGLQLTGDVFSLVMKVGLTLPISISTDGGGGGTTETFNQAGNWTSTQWQYAGMGTGQFTMGLDSNPSSSFLSAINAVTNTTGTTLTMTDSLYGTSSAVTITSVSGSPPPPFGPYSTVTWSTSTAPSGGSIWSNIVTIALGTSGGGGGTSISNILNLFHDGYASPQSTTTFSFATSSQRNAAYTLLNGPGTWTCVGNYMSPFYGGGSPLHGTFSMSMAGPSSTDDNGPPEFMYRVISPSNLNSATSDGPAGPGPFSASK